MTTTFAANSVVKLVTWSVRYQQVVLTTMLGTLASAWV